MNQREKCGNRRPIWILALILLILCSPVLSASATDISGLDAVTVTNGKENASEATITGSHDSGKSTTLSGTTMTLTGDSALEGLVGDLSFIIEYTLQTGVGTTQGKAVLSSQDGQIASRTNSGISGGSTNGTTDITVQNWTNGSTWTLTMQASAGASWTVYKTSSVKVTIRDITFTPYQSDSVTFASMEFPYTVTYYADANATETSNLEVPANGDDVSLEYNINKGVTITGSDYYYCTAVTVQRGEASVPLTVTNGTCYPESGDVITPTMVQDWDKDGIAPFLVNGAYYWLWDDAMTAAGSSGTVILNEDYTLPSRDDAYVVPAGVKFLIPYSSANLFRGVPREWNLQDMNMLRKEFPDPPEVSIISAKQYTTVSSTEFRRLTMPAGTSITVDGALEVSGQTHPLAGGQLGAYSLIQMASGSSITVNNGGTLYAWGYIRGSGAVTAESGAIVYEHFDCLDYPGGGADTLNKLNNAGVFGLRDYSINGIEVLTTYKAGAQLKAYVVITGFSIGTCAFIRNFIGTDANSIFCLTSGTIEKSYVGGRQQFIIRGVSTVNKFSITMLIYTLDTSETSGLPFGNTWDVTIANGATVTLNNSIVMYAGAKVTVDSGGKLIIPSEINGYILDTSSDPSSATNHAKLDVNGEVQVTGALYTSYKDAAIADIISSEGNGKIVVNNIGSETSVMIRGTGNNSESCDITPAKLKNADGTYTSTAATTAGGYGTGTYTYYKDTGLWCPPGHRYESVVTAPTCTAAGFTTHTCIACGHSYTDAEVAASGHTEVVDTAVAPTCTETGLTEGKHCSVCNTVLVAQEEVAALGHKDEDNDYLCDLCSEKLYMTGWSSQIYLIEPWALRLNVVIADRTTHAQINYSAVSDYQFHFLRASDVAEGTEITAQVILENEKSIVYGSEKIFHQEDDQFTYYTVDFKDGIYTYQMDEDIYAMVSFKINGGETQYATAAPFNLKELLEERKDDSAFGIECPVYTQMYQLWEDITAYREGKTDSVTTMGTLLTEGRLGEYSQSSAYKFGVRNQIVLIEPWGLQVNAAIVPETETSVEDHVDYEAAEDYGVVMFYDVDGTCEEVPTEEELLAKTGKAYVFSKTDGSAFLNPQNENYICARYNRDVFTYQLNTNVYALYFVKIDGTYHYSNVRTYNVHALAGERSADEDFDALERAVYTDMVALCDAVTAYRAQFENAES